jgi:hypothetical protein
MDDPAFVPTLALVIACLGLVLVVISWTQALRARARMLKIDEAAVDLIKTARKSFECRFDLLEARVETRDALQDFLIKLSKDEAIAIEDLEQLIETILFRVLGTHVISQEYSAMYKMVHGALERTEKQHARTTYGDYNS